MDLADLLSELSFKATRSGGAGGQHVNKVSSKIELSFDLLNSKVFSVEQKELLCKNLSSKLTNDNKLILFCDETRSQHKNKNLAIQRFITLIKQGLIAPKKRKPTKPSKASIRKKIQDKKKHADKKQLRKGPNLDF
ncbi:aminoacyl-tRNA hydrolase [Flavobacteriaceae bacterium F08102]|nr:aminoacyl-tRNA hydrolase [Flavobacteriaceae bacterium F08102]